MDDLSSYYFNDEDMTTCGQRIASIANEYTDDPPSVVDRFFTRYYFIRPDCLGEDYLVLFHSNRVCLVGLAPTHIALSKGVQEISFDVGNVDRSLNHVKGKGKKGGMILQEFSTLAIIRCDDGSQYKVPSCIRGKLIEVNERVINNTNLLCKEGDGYVAMVLPKPENCEEIKRNLLPYEDYCRRDAIKV